MEILFLNSNVLLEFQELVVNAHVFARFLYALDIFFELFEAANSFHLIPKSSKSLSVFSKRAPSPASASSNALIVVSLGIFFDSNGKL